MLDSDLNPIIEADSSDSETPDIYAPQMRNSLEEIDQPETPNLSALLRQESVRSRFDIIRQESSSKPKQQVLDTFPNIRGFESEHSKSNFSDSSTVPTRRPSLNLKSITDTLKIDINEKELLKVATDEELKSIYSESVTTEKFVSRATTKRTKTFNASNNIEELRAIINSKIMSPEIMLISAIGTIYDFDIPSKKKDNFLISLANEQLEEATVKYSQKLSYQDDLAHDYNKLEKFLTCSAEENIEIEEEIKNIHKNYAENRINIENKIKSTHVKVNNSKSQQEKLNYALKETIENYRIITEENNSLEESFKMMNEDLLIQLYTVSEESLEFMKRNEKLNKKLWKIGETRKKNKMLKEKIKVCTEALCEVTKFVNEENVKKKFSQEFFTILTKTKEEIEEAINVEKIFAKHALTDPKTIMPYYRASDSNIH